MDTTVNSWKWPLNLDTYDCNPTLTGEEQEAIAYTVGHYGALKSRQRSAILHRLLHPLIDVLNYLQSPKPEHYAPVRVLLKEMDRRGTAYWGWMPEQWAETIAPTHQGFWEQHRSSGPKARQQVIAIAYCLTRFKAFDRFPAGSISITRTAWAVFGHDFHVTLERICEALAQWGYQNPREKVQYALADVCLANESPLLADLSFDFLASRRQQTRSRLISNGIALISQVLSELKLIDGFLPVRAPGRPIPERMSREGIAEEWLEWCAAWYYQSPLAGRTKENYFLYLRKIGFWLAEQHPEITSPEQWTYEIALEYSTRVHSLKVGEYVQSTESARFAGLGKELMPRSKDNMLTVARRFFTDLQEVPHRVNDAAPRTIPRRFNPKLMFQTPTSLRRLIGPDPRIIEDARWWKILQAASDLREEDLPHPANGFIRYPIEMVRAVAVTWCYSALRSDELKRLRVGGIRWQWDEAMISQEGEQLPEDAICFLHVPVNKTNTAFWKPVYAQVGRCIEAWEAVRPTQPKAVDRKTNEYVDFLFSYRGGRIGDGYVNQTLIPLLCEKAGIPRTDARGPITSHRARATIATLYYNCPEGLTGLEIQEFLGHKSFRSTQSYIKASPTKLAKSVARANKNSRLVKVLIDSEAAVQGEPAIFYDLGDGTFCGNPAWAACPHRMACIKCPMHVGVDLAEVIQAREGVMHLLQEVPNLSPEEREAAEGDRQAFEKILAKTEGLPPPPVPDPRYVFNPAAQMAVDPELVIPLLPVEREAAASD